MTQILFFRIFSSVLLLTLFSSVSAFECHHLFEAGSGWREDSVEWTTIFPEPIGVETTQKWKHIQSTWLGVQDEIYFCEKGYLRASVNYGEVISGEKNYSQISLREEEIEDDAFMNAETSGYLFDGTIALGIPLYQTCHNIEMIPLIGFSYHQQSFDDNHYKRLLEGINFFKHVKSSYTYQWYGPFIGGRIKVPFSCLGELFCEYQYHWGRYKGRLKDRFVDNSLDEILRNSNVHGQEFILGGRYWVMPRVSCGVTALYRRMSCKNGESTVGGEDMIPVKHASWQTLSLSLLATYCY